MNYNQLILDINDLISCINIHASQQIQDEYQKLMEFKDTSDPSGILEAIHSLTIVIQEHKNNENVRSDNESLSNEIENLKQKYDLIQQQLTNISQTIGPDANKLQAELKLLFDSLIKIIDIQSTKILTIEKKLADTNEKLADTNAKLSVTNERLLNLENNAKTKVKNKLIADLISPLLQDVHDFLGSLPNKPYHYDDSPIYRAMELKAIGNLELENQYKRCCDKTIDEHTYEEFYQWLLNKSNEINISIKYLLIFLHSKKRRNFNEHSNLFDFFADCKQKRQCELKDLLNQNQIITVMEDEEVDSLEKIFKMYYRGKINDIEK